MTQRIEYGGTIHEFPDDFTSQDIQSALVNADRQSVTDVVTSPKFIQGIATGMASKDLQQPVDPGFYERLQQRGRQSLGQSKAPPLQPGSGIGSKAADVVGNIEDYISGLAGAGARGATFGTYDEAGALGKTLAQGLTGQTDGQSFGQRFIQNDTAENAQIDKFKSANPIIGNTAEIAGMITSPIGNSGTNFIQAGTNMATRAGRAALVGAGLGGASGFANSEGGFDQRAKAGAFGAGTGAVIGGTVTPAIELLTRGVKLAGNTIANQWRAYHDPDAQARQLLANALVRDQQSVPNAVSALQSSPGQAVVDVAGPNTVALGRQATVAPGNARVAAEDLFTARQADQAARFQQGLQPIANGQGFQGQMETLIQQRAQSARPLYDALEGIDPERLDTPFFRNLLQSQPGNQLLGRARQIAALEQARGATPVNLIEPLLDAEGNLRTATVPNFRAMDYLKQAADDMVAAHTDPVTQRLQGPVGYQWDQLRRAIVSNLDEAAQNTGPNGENLYQLARGAYAGPSRMMEAMNEGRQFFSSGTAEDAVRAFGQLPPAEQDAFRIGAANDLINKLGNKADNTNAYNLLVNSPNKRMKLQALFPDQATFDRFVEMAQRENQMFRNGQVVLGGSPTSRIDADKADSVQQLGTKLQAIRQLLTGHPIQAANTAITQAGNLQRGMREPVANALGSMMFNPNPQQSAQVLQSLGGTQVNPGLIQALLTAQGRNQQLGRAGTALLSNLGAQGSGKIGSLLAQELAK